MREINNYQDLRDLIPHFPAPAPPLPCLDLMEGKRGLQCFPPHL